MDVDKVKTYFLSKQGVVEAYPFDKPVPVFKVGNKMFGLINIHEPERISINLKYDKEAIGALRYMYDDIQPGYHMHKNHWNTVYLDGHLKEDFVKELIDISYNLVFHSLTKKKQKEIQEDRMFFDASI